MICPLFDRTSYHIQVFILYIKRRAHIYRPDLLIRQVGSVLLQYLDAPPPLLLLEAHRKPPVFTPILQFKGRHLRQKTRMSARRRLGWIMNRGETTVETDLAVILSPTYRFIVVDKVLVALIAQYINQSPVEIRVILSTAETRRFLQGKVR